jgi:hypothetical protein
MYYLQNSVLNSLEPREYILGDIVLIRLLSSRCCCVLLLCLLIEIYLREEPQGK